MEPTAIEYGGRSVTNGRFAPGNTLSRGNPHAARVGQLRSALLAAVTPDDLQAVVVRLIELAKGGDIKAAKLLLDRCVGKFVDAIPSPKSSGIPTHDDNGHPLTFEQQKEWLRLRILRVGGATGEAERKETELDVDRDADNFGT